MSKIIILIVTALVGFGVYELMRRWLLEEQELAAPLRQIGPVRGAAMTAGGHGTARGPDLDGPAAADEVAAPTGCGDCRDSLAAPRRDRRGATGGRAVRPELSGD